MSVVLIVAVLAGFGLPVLTARASVHPMPFVQGGRAASRRVFGYASRACGSCGGNGRQLRLGVRMFLGGNEKK